MLKAGGIVAGIIMNNYIKGHFMINGKKFLLYRSAFMQYINNNQTHLIPYNYDHYNHSNYTFMVIYFRINVRCFGSRHNKWLLYVINVTVDTQLYGLDQNR